MTPERLAHIEVQLRRHPTSPHTVELALEAVEALKPHVAVETIPHVVPADVAAALDVAPTPPAAPARKGKR